MIEFTNMQRSRYLLALAAVAALLLLLVHRSGRPNLIIQPREVLIKHYYRYLEPDWRKAPPPSAVNMRNADKLAMPTWFGSSSLVGSSPYDFVPTPLHGTERKTRILFLLDFPDYLTRMNSHSYEMCVMAPVQSIIG